MRMDLHDAQGRRTRKVLIDLRALPAAVSVPGPGGSQREHMLHWDQTLDDQGRLRRCPACGCEELWVGRFFPPLTGFVVVVVVALICFALYGLEYVPVAPLVGVAGLVIVADLVFVFLSPRYLVCYRCHSRYQDAPIARSHHPWDSAAADRYAQPPKPADD